MNKHEIQSILDDALQTILETTVAIRPNDVGLDDRGGRIHVGEDYIVVEDPKRFDYYCGGEYVDQSLTTTLNGWKIYYVDDGGECRIQEIVDRLSGDKSEDDCVEDDCDE